MNKKITLLCGVTLLSLGLTAGGVALAQTQGTLPDHSVVRWDNDAAFGHVILSNGKKEPIDFLRLSEGSKDIAPVYCIALGAPLDKTHTPAQKDLVNKVWHSMTKPQQELLDNVIHLANRSGGAAMLNGGGSNEDALHYLAGRLAVWQLEKDWGIKPTADVTISEVHLDRDAGSKYNLSGYNYEKDVVPIIQNYIKTAQRELEKPSFDKQTISLVQGVNHQTTDHNGVLALFPNIDDHVKHLDLKVKDNEVNLKANVGSPLGLTKDGIDFKNKAEEGNTPYVVYSTDGDGSGSKSQAVLATTDKMFNSSSLNVDIIGLGATTLTKQDADTKSKQTQGTAELSGAVFGLFNSKGTRISWSDGQKGYPVEATVGEKTNSQNIELKMDHRLKVGVKNLKTDGDYYWQEVTAPEGYSLSTKKYPVKFNASSGFDQKTSNYIEQETASDKVAVFDFMFEKVQDDNGSHLGLNGAAFVLTPKKGTKGKPIEAMSSTGKDNRGYQVNGLVKFDGQANQKAGNPSPDGIAIGQYEMTETKAPKGLKKINPVEVSVTPQRNAQHVVVSYETKFTDADTKKVIDTVVTPTKDLKNNNILVKVNLGQFTDKQIQPAPKPTPAPDKKHKVLPNTGTQILGVLTLLGAALVAVGSFIFYRLKKNK